MMKRKYLIVIILTPLLVFLDQFTKWMVVQKMEVAETIPIIPGFLSLNYLVNPGGAFGLFRNLPPNFRTPFFLLIGAVAILVVLYYLVKSDDNKILFPLCLAFVISGALGNLVDRVRLGHVVDFILVEATFMGDRAVGTLDKWFHAHQWPSFNIADTLIVVGIFGMALDLIFLNPIEAESPEADKAPPREEALRNED